MKVGILGSGEVGRALAQAFASVGHEVVLGTRDPGNDKIQAWLKQTQKSISVETMQSTAQQAELIVIATLGSAVSDVITLAGVNSFDSKIVIDVTNPLDFSLGMPPRLLKQDHNSNGELVQSLLPKAKVVKTLNIIGNALMFKPHFEQGDPDMLLCGNDESAKKEVTDILRSFEWSNITDLGDITQSHLMEVMCLVWVTYGLKHNTWNLAFKFLTQ